ncbi:bile acid:sodium symporter family protein [Sinomicrobium pectinilyticum]|uniref:Bile acid:sodium symporter family protein n=1 Tax=Sinomicrobium pectinilyticum TaxID=1084421 RepID=A0A3N0F3B2_SINP1|nr:bile acid:sodium symporter family protein [Sinomicrobium pectinilyticum]RNL94535.1 bile acid:sodium symporter family protein [Sinomicrobium pectinilyticum]
MIGKLQRISLYISFLAVVCMGGMFLAKNDLWQLFMVAAACFFSVGIGAVSYLKGYQYTAWIITAVIAALCYPSNFLHWGDLDLRHPWLVLLVIQFVMFGMGVQMKLKDFSGLKTSFRGVLVGLLCQFSIMPIIGFILTRVFDFEPEIAAGVILIGACSSGLASNVMVYIARSNLVLSVTVTAVATLVAPFLTPLLMKVLAGTLVEIEFVNMMIQIIKIVLVPIGAALLYDHLKNTNHRVLKKMNVIVLICFTWLIALPLGLWKFLETHLSDEALQSAEIFGFILSAIVAGAVYYKLTGYFTGLDRFMPYVSMFGIIYFTAITTAAGRDNLLRIGPLLFLASVIHNTLGYIFGYWFSRALKLDKNSARSMAFEVGLQNGGMASGLAAVMGKLGTVGLAAAVFSPWMNISGSLLANYWKRNPVDAKKTVRKPKHKFGILKSFQK